MKITFIRPSMGGLPSTDAMEPLVFAILSSLTPARHTRTLVDDRIESIDFDTPCDLAAITVETYTAQRAYEIAAQYRARGIPVVMGGYHATLATDEVLEHADTAVLGDAEASWPRLLADFERGQMHRTYEAGAATSLAGLHFDRSIFAGKRYLPIRLVQFQRGCRFACDFCSIHAFYGDHVATRPIEDVLAELDAMGGELIFFADDNLFADREAARALWRSMEGLSMRWTAQMTIDVTDSDDDVDLLRRSGCAAVLIGFESLQPESLRQMRKGWNARGIDYATRIERLRQRGIMTYGTFVFGYDGDTAESFDTTVDFARRSGLFLANFNPLTPTPGTPLYDRLRTEGRLRFDRWWLDSRWRYADACFVPRRMSPKQLRDGVLRARQRFYGVGSIAGRLFDRRANARSLSNVSLFLLANLTSRREILRKQGQPLGGFHRAAHAGQA